MRGFGAIFGTVVALLVVGLFMTIETVDDGERAVILRGGAVHRVAGPGYNFINPITDSVQTISVRTNSRLYENEPFYSFDRQAADITLSITYRMTPDRVAEVYSIYGGEEGVLTRLVDRRVKKELKEVMGTFTAETAITQRERLGVEVTKALADGVNGPLIIESVQIEDINFSAAYEQSIEDRMLAENKVAKLEQEKRQRLVENEITVNTANADADATRAKAQANADAIRMEGEAHAAAIDARGKALRDNPNVVSLVQAEKWNGQLPVTMVPGSAVPFLNVGPTQ